MAYFTGINVSIEYYSASVVDATGRNFPEAKVASAPEALAKFFSALGFAIVRIDLEAVPLSYWRPGALVAGGLPAILLESATSSGAFGDAGEDQPLPACTKWARIAPVGRAAAMTPAAWPC